MTHLDVFNNSAKDPLIKLAESTYETRKFRLQFLSGDLLGEPVWDILLVVLVTSHKGKCPTVPYLVEEVHGPDNFVHRWINIMRDRNLIEIWGDNEAVQLTEETEHKLFKYLKLQSNSMINIFSDDSLIRYFHAN